MFDFNMSDDSTGGATDELEIYLTQPRNLKVKNPIQYWKSIGDTPLSRMALDVLTAPGKSLNLHCLRLLTRSRSFVDRRGTRILIWRSHGLKAAPQP